MSWDPRWSHRRKEWEYESYKQKRWKNSSFSSSSRVGFCDEKDPCPHSLLFLSADSEPFKCVVHGAKTKKGGRTWRKEKKKKEEERRQGGAIQQHKVWGVRHGVERAILTQLCLTFPRGTCRRRGSLCVRASLVRVRVRPLGSFASPSFQFSFTWRCSANLLSVRPPLLPPCAPDVVVARVVVRWWYTTLHYTTLGIATILRRFRF